MKNEDIPLVSICCLTYNHAPYIRQCLDGFMMQKTDYLFEVVVHDDASTDGTQDVIREYEKKYPDVIKPIYQVENQYSQQIDIFGEYVMPSLKGKYIAFCEGDDYWIDSLKLQKQVSFLEGNTDYGLCYTKAKQYEQKRNRFSGEVGKEYLEFDMLLFSNPIPTLTTLFRTQLITDYQNEIKPESHNWMIGDYPIWLYIAKRCKVKFLSEITSVYRVLCNSASHFDSREKTLRYQISSREVAYFYAVKFKIREKDVLSSLQCFHMELACLLGDRVEIEGNRIAMKRDLLKRKKFFFMFIGSYFPSYFLFLLNLFRKIR